MLRVAATALEDREDSWLLNEASFVILPVDANYLLTQNTGT
jgi:hypothetical protein